MDNKKKLLLPLLLLVITVTAAGVGRLLWIGPQLNGEGPLALAPLAQGGFLLSTGKAILEFDTTGAPRRTVSSTSLGLQEIGAVQQGADGSLWLFDKGRRQLFRCTPDGLCEARTPRDLTLDKNAQFTVSAERDLVAIADNANHRLLLLDKGGRLLLDSSGTLPLHYPNQLQFDGDALLVADSDRYAITRIPLLQDGGLHLGAPATVLATQRRPYRYAHADDGWWVLEAGTSLVDGKLYFYAADGPRRAVDSRAGDIVDFLSDGERLLLASRRDHLLLGLNKRSWVETTLGGAELNAQWQEQAQREQQLLRERRLIPVLMVAVLLPLLLLAALLEQQQRRRAEARAAAPVDATLPAALQAGHPVSLRPDALGRETITKERNLILGIAVAGLLLVPGLCWLAAGMPALLAWKQPELWPLLAVILIAVPTCLAGIVLAFRQQAQKLSRELVFDSTGVTLLESSRCIAKAGYARVQLTQATLEIGGISLPLYLNAPQRLAPFWPRALLKELLAQQTPPPSSPADAELPLEIADGDRRLLRRQLWLTRIAATTGLGLGALLGAQLIRLHLPWVLLLPLGAIFAIFLALLLYTERFFRDHTGARLLLSEEGLTLLRQARPPFSVPYTQVWLGDNLLVAGDKAVRLMLRQNALTQRMIELFPLDRLRETLAARLPAGNHFDSDVALMFALLKRRNRYALTTALQLLVATMLLALLLYLRLNLKP